MDESGQSGDLFAAAAFVTLAAYPGVAAVHVNPLDHYLNNGIQEGRSPFGDGTWH